MAYWITRQVPEPTFEQLGRAFDQCPVCSEEQAEPTFILPSGLEEGMEQIADLAIGDALDGPWERRNRLGLVCRGYDRINHVKHEIYKLDEATVRCRRMR